MKTIWEPRDYLDFVASVLERARLADQKWLPYADARSLCQFVRDRFWSELDELDYSINDNLSSYDEWSKDQGHNYREQLIADWRTNK